MTYLRPGAWVPASLHKALSHAGQPRLPFHGPAFIARLGSTARPGSPRGMPLRMVSSYFLSMAAVMSEAMKPGATALQVMVRPEYSRAVVLVRPMTPACGTAGRGRIWGRYGAGMGQVWGKYGADMGQVWGQAAWERSAGRGGDERGVARQCVRVRGCRGRLRLNRHGATAHCMGQRYGIAPYGQARARPRPHLGGRVVGLAGVADNAHHTGDVDDAALLLLAHDLRGVLCVCVCVCVWGGVRFMISRGGCVSSSGGAACAVRGMWRQGGDVAMKRTRRRFPRMGGVAQHPSPTTAFVSTRT